MPLSRRLPKRGFRNPFRKVIQIVNIDQLKIFPVGTVVTEESLIASGLVKGKGDGIKVLGKGEIGYPLCLKIAMVSDGARKKIEAAGGSIVEVA